MPFRLIRTLADPKHVSQRVCTTVLSRLAERLRLDASYLTSGNHHAPRFYVVPLCNVANSPVILFAYDAYLRSRLPTVLEQWIAQLDDMAYTLQAYQDKSQQVTVQRQGGLVQLTVTPKTWAGRGILGSTLIPM